VMIAFLERKLARKKTVVINMSIITHVKKGLFNIPFANPIMKIFLNFVN
jgi:hypothetical protein